MIENNTPDISSVAPRNAEAMLYHCQNFDVHHP
jgi:hypothetical protein